MKLIMITIVFFFIGTISVCAHPEFQRYSREVSGRAINCSMCHKHSDGPDGLKPGQIGSLTPDELNDLGLARQAFKPGNKATNPILNEFGNLMLNDLGKEKILALRQHPELLSAALSKTSDLDGDGITDAEEYQDGTHPLISLDGRPGKLFKNNLRKNWFHILMISLATGLGLFGLQNALFWLSSKMDKDQS